MINDIDIFVSFSDKDTNKAEEICEKLEKKNLKCWLEVRDVKLGQSRGASIKEAIESSEFVLIVISNNANYSTRVEREVQIANRLKKSIIPIFVEDITLLGAMKYHLSGINSINLVNNMGNGLDHLAKTVLNSTELNSIHRGNNDLNKIEDDEKSAAKLVSEYSVDNSDYNKKSEKSIDEKDYKLDVVKQQNEEVFEIDQKPNDGKLHKLNVVEQENEEATEVNQKPNDKKDVEFKNLDGSSKRMIKKEENGSTEESVEEKNPLSNNITFPFLKTLDKILFVLSLFFFLYWLLGILPFIESINGPSFLTFLFLFLTSCFLILEKSIAEDDNEDYPTGFFIYPLIFFPVIHSIAISITSNWFWLTIIWITSLITLFIIILGINKFSTRFATGVLFSYWLLKIHLYLSTNDLDFALSYGIRDTISEYNWVIVLIGLIFVLFNRKLRSSS